MALVSFLLMSWFSAYVQCSYCKCLCATRPVNCQVLAWLYLYVWANKQVLCFYLKLFFCLVLAWFYISVSYALVPPVTPYGIFKLVTYLRPHFWANGVYMAIRCIRMQLICLLSMSSPCWQPSYSYPFGSKQKEGIESKSMLCVHHSDDWGH